MRIMLDTCILFSALLWPESKPALVLFHVVRHHQLIMCGTIIDELHEVIARKAGHALPVLDAFLSEISYEIAQSTDDVEISISDPKDQPIINAAISGDVDVLVSSDKHFLILKNIRPKIVSVNEYISGYMYS